MLHCYSGRVKSINNINLVIFSITFLEEKLLFVVLFVFAKNLKEKSIEMFFSFLKTSNFDLF